MCSCSPTVFNFVLDLSNINCAVDTIIGNPGVETSICFQEEVDAVPGQPPASSFVFVEDVEPLTEEEERCYAFMDSTAVNGRIEQDGYVEFLNLLADGYLADNGITTYDELSLALKYAWTTLTCQCTTMGEKPNCCQADRANLFVEGSDGEPVSEAQVNFLNDICKTAIDTLGQEGMVNFDFDPMQRALQDDPVVEVFNAQFLEFDTSGDLTIINQDSTYADVSLGDGATLTFPSISSLLDTSVPLADQMSSPALVPGGASLILYGKTAGGEVVKNRFFWLYNMECGRDTNPVQVGDQIGWVRVVSMHIVFSFVFSIVKMS